MDTKLLEDIGLTKGEIAVYFALLELGSSTVTPIVDKSKVSSSKVYLILDRLINKGLASFVIKENTKYFEAAPPVRILDLVKERKANIEQQEQDLKEIIPELELRQKLQELKSEAHVFKGNKGFKTAFRDIITILKPGERLLVMGISKFDPEFRRMIVNFHQDRAKARIHADILLNFAAKTVGEELALIPKTNIRYLPGNVVTPGVFLIYSNKTLISLPNERTFFRIENQDATDSFRAYFNTLWDQKISAFEGNDATTFFDNILTDLKPSEEYYVLNGNTGIEPSLTDYFKDYHKKRHEKGIKVNLLLNHSMRHLSENLALEPAELKFLPPDFKSPLQMTFYGDKLYISLWSKKPIGFLIQRKDVVDAFRTYFDHLWKQDTMVLSGKEGIVSLCEEVLKENKDLYLIGANSAITKTHPKYFQEWDKKRAEQGIRRHHLSTEDTKGSDFNSLPNSEVHYLPKEFKSPMVIWVFANKVAHVLWDDMIVFLVDNQKIADDYRKYFGLLKNQSHPA
ncbi:MAG: hypothetical protein KJ601_03340 [Nanoarchaeota archaeon]|nr:hypothetical protein [Nanoarchaeota archaeon]MBU1704869.1 hypothetical protein [Nanoarchaeota archaeon]